MSDNEEGIATISKGQILLSGIVGSTAYGLNTLSSDIDRLGIYAAPTEQFHGLRPPVGKSATRSTTDPDITYHEAGKYASLALKCNPSVLELLWLPEYDVATSLGQYLIHIRQAFLSAERVRNAYFGYATEQLARLIRRNDGSFDSDLRTRAEKHSRHIMRLLQQGLELYSTGEMTVRLANPEEVHAFGWHVAEADTEGRSQILGELVDAYSVHFDMARSPLPEYPDRDVVEEWLYSVRREFYEG